MNIAERLRALREENEKPLNQTQLGEKLHKSQKAISRLETGESELSAEDIIAYCLYYKVSADYILGLPRNLEYPEK